MSTSFTVSRTVGVDTHVPKRRKMQSAPMSTYFFAALIQPFVSKISSSFLITSKPTDSKANEAFLPKSSARSVLSLGRLKVMIPTLPLFPDMITSCSNTLYETKHTRRVAILCSASSVSRLRRFFLLSFCF